MQSAKRTESRVQEISDITRNLKIMAKELNVPVIALSQLSRAAERRQAARTTGPSFPTCATPALSSRMPTSCCSSTARPTTMPRTARQNQANENEAECIVAKNRHGETSVVRLGWDGAHTRFSNLDVTHEF